MLKAIVFDLYGTLLDIHTDEEQTLLWEKMAYFYSLQGAYYAAEELKDAYAKHVGMLQDKQRLKGVDFPDIDLLKAFKNLYKDKHVKASKPLLKETATFFRVLSLEYVCPYPGTLELLEYLKASPYKVILLSNAQEAFTMDELRVTGIKHYFDAIYLSSQHKVSKPSPKFFHVMLDHCHLEPEECLFIGNDHTTDIDGATRVGMESLYLHTNCSQPSVPEVLSAKWRVDSGSLFEVLEVVKAIEAEWIKADVAKADATDADSVEAETIEKDAAKADAAQKHVTDGVHATEGVHASDGIHATDGKHVTVNPHR